MYTWTSCKHLTIYVTLRLWPQWTPKTLSAKPGIRTYRQPTWFLCSKYFTGIWCLFQYVVLLQSWNKILEQKIITHLLNSIHFLRLSINHDTKRNIEFGLLYPWQFLSKVGPFSPANVRLFIGHIEVTRKEDAYKFDLLNNEYFLRFNFFKLNDYLWSYVT